MEADEFSDGDKDDEFDEDMEALRRACMATGASPSEVVGEESDGDDSGGESSDTDDIDLLRRIRERFSVPTSSSGAERMVAEPLDSSLLTTDDDEDDFETLRAIQRRFQQYQDDTSRKKQETHSDEAALISSGVLSGKESSEILLERSTENSLDVVPYCLDNNQATSTNSENELREFNDWSHPKGAGKPTVMPRHFSKSCQLFVNALKKNRSCQKFIRNKMIQIEAKIEENRDLKERIKCLMDFQTTCNRRAGRMLSQNIDPRVRLISKSRTSRKVNGKATDCGPPENSCVSTYKMVLIQYPVSLSKPCWSMSERENLAKGIKQQYQEMLFLNSMELDKESDSIGDSNALSVLSFNDFDVASENFRSFLPLVNWDRLASMYLTGRTGAECEARWLNSEDPLINSGPWTAVEDKKILFIAQSSGVFNWFDIAVRLGTHRTPFQCLVRYQRSLNAYILKKDWTEDEDVQLCTAVETFGEDWQLVSSSLEGRTGPQCSNRWRKTLHPDRKRVGRWSIEEDKRLKVAVLLFGAKNWNKIAHFAPGRTQSQCRERWVNCLDPSLNLEPWTEEEDSKLKTAIAEFGHCWSKIATCVPPRTDNQCRRRWKVLLPHEVPLLQAERKMKKAVLISNFVDREKERPLIGPADFHFVGSCVSATEENDKPSKKRKKTTSNEQTKKKMMMYQEPFSSDIPQPNRLQKVEVKKSKRNLAAYDRRNTCKVAEVTEKEKKGRCKPTEKRNRRVKSTENRKNYTVHLEPALSGFTESASVDEQTRLDIVCQSVHDSTDLFDELGSVTDADCLLCDTTINDVSMKDQTEIERCEDQALDIYSVNTTHQNNGKMRNVPELSSRIDDNAVEVSNILSLNHGMKRSLSKPNHKKKNTRQLWKMPGGSDPPRNEGSVPELSPRIDDNAVEVSNILSLKHGMKRSLSKPNHKKKKTRQLWKMLGGSDPPRNEGNPSSETLSGTTAVLNVNETSGSLKTWETEAVPSRGLRIPMRKGHNFGRFLK